MFDFLVGKEVLSGSPIDLTREVSRMDAKKLSATLSICQVTHLSLVDPKLSVHMSEIKASEAHGVSHFTV